ncbi:MAG: tetratricopeptide repeat protein [Gammaproteobacteria bacterium]|nr:tetratricopeptide repeat protein [Gammaproteobacteria bacterium]MBT4494175.1 tetratricopeptide repeat protein [Gammaproteobacteria bacterium]
MRRFVALCLLFIVAGCATTEMQPQAEVVEVEPSVEPEVKLKPEAKPKPKPQDYPVAPFEGDALYQLLVAEIAGYRSRYDVALEKYMVAAEETLDPGVAARATRLALYLKKDDVALRTVEIWADREPDNIDAHRHAVDLLLRAGQHEDAIAHMEAVKNLGGLARFEVFAYSAANLSAEERHSLLDAVTDMSERHPGDEQLIFSRAILLEQEGRFEEALILVDGLLQNSTNINFILLKVSLLANMQHVGEARTFLEMEVEKLPENRRLRLVLARMLFEQKDLPAAKAQYQRVLEKAPNDGDVLFALALIALQHENDEGAKRYFERMVRWNRRPGEAHFYLGSIAERKSDSVTALKEYRQVGDGYEFVPAQARIARLLVDEGQWEEARQHLHRARVQRQDKAQQLILVEGQLLAERGQQIEVFEFLDSVLVQQPDNVELLYFRAMTGQRFDRLDILEQDLSRVIELDPGNADALNALGYTLTDQTDRHDEALVLIEKALAIKPDEAAFLDSMGWVQYRLDNYDLAIEHLRRALSLFQNDEVAAHLGEVLWVVGEKIEAYEVWNDALELAPDSEILKNVIQRFREQ